MNRIDGDSPAARLPYAEFVALTALLMALNAMAIDVLLPSLQQMGAALSVAGENARQLPLTAYIATFGISQLIYGTISDRFGRRPVLIFGLILYTVACIAASTSTTFGFLLAMRAVQGIGAGATRVISIAVVRDTYHGRKMASVMSLAMMVFMAVPIFAPSIGQGIAALVGWRGILGVMAFAGLSMLLWCAIRLPETLAVENRRPLQARSVIQAFAIVLGTRQTIGYALAIALQFGFLFGFLNSAQQVYQGLYGIGPWFPVAFAAGAVSIAISSFTNSRLVQRFGMRRLSHGALLGFVIAAGLLWIAAAGAAGRPPFWVFFVLTLILFGAFGFIGTNFNALAIEPLGRVAGTASSVIGSIQTVLGGGVGAIIGYAYDGTVTPLATGMSVLSLASFMMVAVTERGNLFGRREALEQARSARAT
jgi:DHA1 family bicyclomycin/chloramphenicol resistance-like MFS transporter